MKQSALQSKFFSSQEEENFSLPVRLISISMRYIEEFYKLFTLVLLKNFAVDSKVSFPDEVKLPAICPHTSTLPCSLSKRQ